MNNQVLKSKRRKSGRLSVTRQFNKFSDVIGGQNLGRNLRERIQVLDSAYEALELTDPIEVVTNFTEVITSILPEKMAELQHLDNQISPALNFVKEDRIPTKNNIYKVRSRNARKLFYQFDRLILKKGVLHRLYIQEDIEYHQLVLPQKLQGKVLEALHDNMGHQALERTLDLLRGEGLLAFDDLRYNTMDW